MGNFNKEKPLAENDSVSVPKNLVYLGSASLAIHALSGALVVGKMINPTSTPPNPEGPFEVGDVTRTAITLEQEGEKYVLQIDKLPKEVKDSLIKQRPDLESFLTNGPINMSR